MSNVQVSTKALQAHVDWKAILGAVGVVATAIVQQAPGIIALPPVQQQPEEVKVLTIAVQVASFVLALYGEFGIRFGASASATAPQDAGSQSNARPPAPAAPQPLVSNLPEEGK